MNRFKNITKNFLYFFHEHNIVFALLFLLIVIFSILSPRFFSIMNFKNIIIQNTHLFVIAIGIMIIMSSGGLDFSINGQMSLTCIMLGIAFEKDIGTPAVILILIVIGALCGLFNGLLVSYFHIVPILATLLSGILFSGLANILSRGNNYTKIPDEFRMVTQLNVAGVSVDVWIALFCFLVVFFMFNFTVIGKYITALGSGGTRMMLQAGVNVNKIKIISYMLGSMFIAIAAAIIVARQGMANTEMGNIDYGLLGLYAVYIGGITPSVFRSAEPNQKASVVHVIAGVFVIVIVRNGVQLAEMNQYVESVLIGIVLLITVLFRSANPFGYMFE